MKQDRARVGLEQADQHLEHDALADARAADDGERLARVDIEVEPGVDDLWPEGLLDPPKADERLA